MKKLYEVTQQDAQRKHVLSQLGAMEDDYMAAKAEVILKHVRKIDVNPRQFYAKLKQAEYYLTDFYSDSWSDDGFEGAMKTLVDRDRLSFETHLSPIAVRKAERKLFELAQTPDLPKETAEAYGWLATNTRFLDEIYHKNIMDHW